jgi:hypothetical protein
MRTLIGELLILKSSGFSSRRHGGLQQEPGHAAPNARLRQAEMV